MSKVKLDFSNKNTLGIIVFCLLAGAVITYAMVCWIQILLLALWEIEQTKLQIFVAMVIIKALTWN